MQSNRGGGQCVCLLVQIVRQDRTMEEIVFPVPNICEFLTSESKLRVYYTTERDEQGSKINDFFLRAEDLFNEMNWQKKLRGEVKMQDMPNTRDGLIRISGANRDHGKQYLQIKMPAS